MDYSGESVDAAAVRGLNVYLDALSFAREVLVKADDEPHLTGAASTRDVAGRRVRRPPTRRRFHEWSRAAEDLNDLSRARKAARADLLRQKKPDGSFYTAYEPFPAQDTTA